MELGRKMLNEYLQKGDIESVIYLLRKDSSLSLGATELAILDAANLTLAITGKDVVTAKSEEPKVCAAPNFQLSDLDECSSAIAIYYDLLSMSHRCLPELFAHLSNFSAVMVKIFLYAIGKNNCNVLGTLHGRYKLGTDNLIYTTTAIKEGAVAALEWLRVNQFKVDLSIISIASLSLEMAVYLRTKFDLDITGFVYDAVCGNNLVIMEKLLPHIDIGLFNSCLLLAIKTNSTDVAIFFINKCDASYFMINTIFDESIRCGNELVVAELYKQKYRFNSQHYITLIEHPNKEIIKVLRNHV